MPVFVYFIIGIGLFFLGVCIGITIGQIDGWHRGRKEGFIRACRMGAWDEDDPYIKELYWRKN